MSSVQDILSPVTISNYGKLLVDGVTQHNPLWKMLKKSGQIERNVSGDLFTWNLEAGRFQARITSDDEDHSANYTPRKRYQRPQLDWGQIVVLTRFSKGILRQNNGAQALVKLRDKEIPAMFRDAIYNTNGLHYQLLNQAGNSYTGTGLPIFGLPSAFTGVTWAASLKEGTIGSGATYAGLTMSISGLSGTVDGAEPDAWTPTAINTTANTFMNTGAANLNFRGNCFEILTYAIARGNRFSNSEMEKKVKMGLLTQTDFIGLGTQIEGKQTIFLSGKVGRDSEMGLGSNSDVLYHGGIPIYWDENLPANTGYLLNTDQMGFKIQPLVEWGKAESGMATEGEDSDWFELDIDYNSSRRSITVSATNPSQFWFNPRYLVQLYAGA